MKKLSINVFTVLAIVFAVASAYTSGSARKAQAGYAIYANQSSNTYLPSGCSDASFEQRDIPTVPKLYAPVFSQTGLYTKVQLDDFAVLHCTTATPNRVCFVVLNIKDGSPDLAFATSPVVTASGASSCSIYYGAYN